MLKIDFEFRKGIFFIRLFGELTNHSYKEETNEIEQLIIDNRFKYIVINTNYLEKIDISGLSYINKIYYLTKEYQSNLIICDKHRLINNLIDKSIPNIIEEIEVL